MNEGAGDWICTDASCGNINFARRVSCYRCNKDRPDGGKAFKKKLGTEIGKSAAEKSRGLFNADDWQCNKCANVNWARRTTCNVCNAPKFGEVEARTGYGGGYNERGVVEYRRREPSSDDEYDEFGRKKRKRKLDAQNTVGITEGPLAKKMPPALLQMELNTDAKEDPAPNVSMQTNKDADKARGSLSDSSTSELPPLSKMAFRRHQLKNQTSYNRQDHMSPSFKTNGAYLRKRFLNSIDQESFNNKIASKLIKHEIHNSATKFIDIKKTKVKPLKLRPFKTDVANNFPRPTPTGDGFEYSLEERVKIAAYAIVHNNCRITSDKFEAIYDKPAPDFQTIFAWRQRLLEMGCLNDSHISSKNQSEKKNVHESTNYKNNINSPAKPQPNPEEISISDGENDYTKVQNNKKATEIIRSASAETVFFGKTQNVSEKPGTAPEQASQVGNHSSPRHGVPSSSRDSQDSYYSESDLEKADISSSKSKLTPNKSNGHQNKQSIVVSDSGSDSISYDSDYVDFLSRVYGEGKQPRCRLNKRRTPDFKTSCESSSNDYQVFQGYSTVKKSEQSPLATGNIYTSNVKNMQAKNTVHFVETDGGSAEYVPTKLGSSTKKNYQDFKNNVKKGFWAKGNRTTVPKSNQPSQEKSLNNHNEPNHDKLSSVLLNSAANIPIISSSDDGNETTCTNSRFGCVPEQPQMVEPHGADFTKDDFEQMVTADNYTSFDKPLQSNDSSMVLDNSSRIFDVVQSNMVQKNKSIMEIFDVFEEHSEPDTNCMENNTAGKSYTMVWDEDDDALYKDDDAEVLNENSQNPHPNKIEKVTETYINNQLPQFITTVNTTTENQPTSKESLQSNFETLHSPYQQNDSKRVMSQVMQSQMTKDENIFTNSLPNEVTPILQSSDNKFANVPLNPAKKINIIESITITPSSQTQPQIVVNTPQITSNILVPNNTSPLKKSTKENVSGQPTNANVNLSSILSGINTDTLLLALQNLQQLAQKPPDPNHRDTPSTGEASAHVEPLETINLTNDEDWEKDSEREGSIERQLKQLHGSTGDTPFLSDIFDPGPVIIPPNVANKLNINNQQNDVENLPDHQENPLVIGNFKSFALPKPIMLNRLKLIIRQKDKKKQSIDGRKRRRKKSKASASGEEEAGAAEAGEDGDEEESGDDADLSKYDLWGSDDEKGQSSKTETIDKAKDEAEAGAETDAAEKNGKSDPIENKTVNKTVKRRSRSGSSSSSSTSSSSSSRSSSEAPKNKFDDFNLNSEREASPPARRSRSRSHSPHSRGSGTRRKSHSRSGDFSRKSRTKDYKKSHESREKQASRERERRERRGSRSRSRSRPARKERRYSRDGANHYGARGRHR